METFHSSRELADLSEKHGILNLPLPRMYSVVLDSVTHKY